MVINELSAPVAAHKSTDHVFFRTGIDLVTGEEGKTFLVPGFRSSKIADREYTMPQALDV